MDETIINNWNNKVQKDDHVFILGDFCWGKEEQWIEYLQQLCEEFCKKYDFDEVNDNMIIPIKSA